MKAGKRGFQYEEEEILAALPALGKRRFPICEHDGNSRLGFVERQRPGKTRPPLLLATEKRGGAKQNSLQIAVLKNRLYAAFTAA